jgi:uncharacterized surface protein with fasciclin (FAS1) repeats
MPRLFGAFAAMASLALAGCGSQTTNAQENAGAPAAQGAKNLSALEKADDLSTATRLLKAADLEKLLTGPGSYTLFAPSDAAFNALPGDQRKQLESTEGRPQLIALLRQHMTPGYVTPGDFSTAVSRAGSRVELASLGAGPIVVRKQGDQVLLGDGANAARIVGGSVPVGNSIVYRIDNFLPPAAR